MSVRQLRAPLILVMAMTLFRFMRGSLVLLAAALVGTLIAVLGARALRERRTGVVRDDAHADPRKPFDPATVQDARYEDID
jgi:hypothetical protein